MTKDLQIRILNHLNSLKMLGYNYCDSIDINSCSTSSFDLPNDLELLNQFVQNCNLCEFSKYKTKIDFSQGNKNSKIIFVDQMPSIIEDDKDKLLLGKSGELLINMIEKVLKISYEEFYYTNIIKCKISSKKEPTQTEINCCKPYISKQIELIKPKLIVALGEETYRSLTNDKTSIEQIRGTIAKFNGTFIIPIYHPSYLLRNPSAKKEAYVDMLKIKSLLETM